MTTFGATFGKIWTTLYFGIWSHYCLNITIAYKHLYLIFQRTEIICYLYRRALHFSLFSPLSKDCNIVGSNPLSLDAASRVSDAGIGLNC